jgi:hypothetical protein
MNVRIEAVGPIKQGQKGQYFTAKITGGKWVNIDGGEDVRQKINGKDCSITVRPSANPKYNDWAKIDAVAELEPAKANGHAEPEPMPKRSGKPTWLEYAAVARAAHALAVELEPDDVTQIPVPISDDPQGAVEALPIVKVDRSGHRMTFVETVLISFEKGAFEGPADDEGSTPF